MRRNNRHDFFNSVKVNNSSTPKYKDDSTTFSDRVASKVKFSKGEPSVHITDRVEEEEKLDVWYTTDDHEIFRSQIDATLEHLSSLGWDESLMDDEEHCLRGLEEYFYNEIPGFTLADFRKACVNAVLRMQNEHRMKSRVSGGASNFKKSTFMRSKNGGNTAAKSSSSPELATQIAEALKERNESCYVRAKKVAAQDREDADEYYQVIGELEVLDAAERKAIAEAAEFAEESKTKGTEAADMIDPPIKSRSLARGSMSFKKEHSERYNRDSLSYTREQKELLLDKLRMELIEGFHVTEDGGEIRVSI